MSSLQRPLQQTPGAGPGFERQLEFAHVGAGPSYCNCRRPAPGTIRAAVLDALLAGRTFTSLEAWRELGTSRLAADVFELRRMGWPILAEEIGVEARDGRSPRVARYRLAEVQP